MQTCILDLLLKDHYIKRRFFNEKDTYITVCFPVSFLTLGMAAYKDLSDIGLKLTVVDESEEFIAYSLEENGFTYYYEETTSNDVVYTKKYRMNESSNVLTEDYETSFVLVGDMLSITVKDNILNTTETTQTDVSELISGEPDYTDMAKCSSVWPAGFTGKKSIASGHSYAQNWRTLEGISKVGTRDHIVKIPDKNFDEYTRLVDSLVTQEATVWPIVGSVHALGLIVNAVYNKAVTVATVKLALKTVGKDVPVVGQVISLVTYLITANKAYDARIGLTEEL